MAATVVAGMALANPASAAAPASVSQTPSTAYAFDTSTATFTVTTPDTGNTVNIEASIPAAGGTTGGTNPLSLALSSGAASGTMSATVPNTNTGKSVYYIDAQVTEAAGKNSFTINVGSSQTGTITVVSGGAATDTTRLDMTGVAIASVNVPSASPRATSTVAVTAHNSTGADFDVTKLAANPSSVTGYSTDPNISIVVTATGNNGADVAGATVHSSVTPLSGGAATGAAGTTTFVYTAASLAGKSGIVYTVNNGVGGTAGTTTSVPVSITDVGAIDQTSAPATLTTPSDSNPVPDKIRTTGTAVNVPFTVALTTNAGAKPAPAGLKVGFDATYADGTKQRVVATTGSDGKATATIPVTAVNAADTKNLSVTAYLGGDTTVGSGSAVSNAKSVQFQVSNPGIVANDAQAVVGGAVTVPVTVTDQFGASAGAGDTVSFTVSGHNSASGTVTVGSNGKATVSYTDTVKAGVSTSDTVTVSDLTHPAYNSGYAADLSATVTYVASVTPGSLAFNAVLTSPEAVSATATQTQTVTLKSDKGDLLVGQPVTISVDRGWVGGTTAVNSGKTTYQATTDGSGVATFYVGSEQAGIQTVTATAGGVSKADTNTVTYTALGAYTVTLSGPTSVTAGASAAYTAKVADKFGNGIAGENVTFTATDPSVLPGGVAPLTVQTGPAGTVTVTIKAGSSAGTVTATDSAITGAGTTNTASAKYTVNAVSFIAIDGANGAKPGTPEKVAVHVYPAAAVAVNVSVSGANAASGVVMTDATGRGTFYYTPSKAGTDKAVASVGAVSGSATITVGAAPSAKPDQVPTLGAVSKTAGTVNIAVQTHPTVTARKIKLYYVHKVRGHKATLVYAGSALTNGKGRAHAVLKFAAGSTVVLKARMAGSDYVEHLSNRVPVTVK